MMKMPKRMVDGYVGVGNYIIYAKDRSLSITRISTSRLAILSSFLKKKKKKKTHLRDTKARQS